MPRLSKIELSPDNGCVIDMKWSLGPLSYRASALGKVEVEPSKDITRLPEVVLYDHIGFKGSYARTNLSFHYVGDYWNDRMSCVIVVSGIWRFYRDDYYKGPYWDLGPGCNRYYSFETLDTSVRYNADVLRTSRAQPQDRVKPAPPWP